MTREIPVRNPRTGAVDHILRPLDAQGLDEACAALRAGQPRWEALGVEGRVAAMRAFSEALARHREPILAALVADTGRYGLSVMEFEALRAIMEGRCRSAPKALAAGAGRSDSDPTIRFEQQYVPYGLVGVISPWNYPLILSLLDAIPALLAGSAVAIKPSEVTPRFVEPLLAAIREVPALAPVLGVFPGDGETGGQIVDLADCIVFTGSVRTGRLVHERAAAGAKPVFLELGGNDAAIVLDTADPDVAAEIVVRGSIENSGQLCSAIERVYVHESLAEAFLDRLKARVAELRMNTADVAEGELGPIILDRQAGIIRAHLEDAVAHGARVLAGGRIVEHGGGLWCEPTILVDVDHTMRTMREETFGPIIPVMTFRTEDEAVGLANDTTYGLSAAVIGEEAAAIRVGRRLAAGGIWINDFDTIGSVGEAAEKTAFGASGLGGTRYGPGGFMRFLRKKALVVRDLGARAERPAA